MEMNNASFEAELGESQEKVKDLQHENIQLKMQVWPIEKEERRMLEENARNAELAAARAKEAQEEAEARVKAYKCDKVLKLLIATEGFKRLDRRTLERGDWNVRKRVEDIRSCWQKPRGSKIWSDVNEMKKSQTSVEGDRMSVRGEERDASMAMDAGRRFF